MCFLLQKSVPIGDAVISTADTCIGFEICEELWMPRRCVSFVAAGSLLFKMPSESCFVVCTHSLCGTFYINIYVFDLLKYHRTGRDLTEDAETSQDG